METAGIALVAQGAANYFSDLKSATKATDSFVDGVAKGSGKVDAAAGGMSKAFSLVGPAIVTGAALAITAVAGIGAAAFGVASDINQAGNDMQASLGVTAEEAARLSDTVLDVWGNNFGDSIKDVSDGIIVVRQQMKGLTDQELQGVTEKAFALRDVFGTDLAESTNAANVLMQKFGLTSDAAFDLITTGFQKGLNNSGDFLESVMEYGVQFSEAGFSAQEFFSALETGQQGASSLGTDKIADLVKEGRIRIMELTDDVIGAFESVGAGFEKNITTPFNRLGDNTQFADEVISKLQAMGLEGESMRDKLESGAISVGAAFRDSLAEGVRSGTITAADAQQILLQNLAKMDNQVYQNTAGVAIFGTQWEDLGASAVLATDFMSDSFADVAGATDKLNAKYDNWPAMWEGIKRSALVAIEPIGAELLDLANDVMPIVQKGFDWLKNDLPPIITSVTAAIDSGVGFITSLFQNDLGPALDSNAAFFNRTFTSIENIVTDVASIVQIALGALAGFIDDHGATIQRIVDNTWSSIQAVIGIALALVEGVVKTTLALIQGDWTGAWTAITDMSASIVTDLWTIISGGLDNLLALFQDLTGNVQQSWDVMIDDALTAGSGLVAGIQQGVKDSWDGFVDWIIDLATGLIDEFLRAWGIKSPGTKWVPAGSFAVEGIMLGFSNMWPHLTALVSGLSKDLIDQVADIGSEINGIIADSFGATASIDRQLAKNLDRFKDVLPDYRQYTEGALKQVENEARAFLDPAEGAKFFKVRSDQILEYAKLQKDLSEAKYQEDKDRIQKQMSLIASAQRAEVSQLNAIPRNNPMQALIDQISKLFNNPKIADLEEQYAKAKTDKERAEIKKELDALRIPVNDTGIGHDLMQMMNQIMKMFGIVPRLASGGIARKNQPHWIGEDGPEIFWPQMSGVVSPAASSQQLAARANNNQSYDYSRHVTMPIYTNNSPAAVQQSWAITQASMP